MKRPATAPSLRWGVDPAVVEAVEWVDNGPGWLAVLLPDAKSVLDVVPGAVVDPVGVVGPHPAGSEHAIEVRAFIGDGGTTEDPVTGSLNASLAQWLLGSGRITAPYVSRQGTALGRAGDVFVDQGADGTVWVGGATRTLIEGTAAL